MTVAELKKALEAYPDDTQVYVDWDGEGGMEDPITRIETIKRPYMAVSGIKLCQ